jgi:D-alanyl-D-alanine carboxypeptidase
VQQWLYNLGPNSQNKMDMFNPDNHSSYQDYLKIMTKYFNLDNPAPYLSARSWVMMNMDTRQLMFAKQETQQRQVASLTKIMTSMVIIDFLEKHRLDPKKINVNILSCCITANLGGTSAELIENETMNVHELLHGMMLPSGNDAA